MVFTPCQKIGKILDVFEQVRKKPEHDAFHQEGRRLLEKHLERFVLHDLPIQFALPAFPCKSPNIQEKVLGSMPDKGEEIALQNLDGFCKEVSAIHQIGCELLIICDGRVFADIIGVPDETVTEYDLALREIVQSMHLKFSSLDDIFPHTTHQQKRQQLVDLFGRQLFDIKKNLQHDEDQQRLYCGLTRFLMEDKIWQGRSKNSIQKECKEKAILMMQRNDAYSALVAQSFPNHIRLSIHPHSNTHKFGINLISGNDRWGTPWHNVLVARADGSYELMKRKEAQERKYTLVWEQGRPSYFVE